MKKPESFTSHFPLVIFTWALLAAAGLTLGVALGGPATCRLAALFLAGLGGIASFLHLGHKERAPLALRGFRHSWLSREGLLAGLFAAALFGSILDARLGWLAATLGGALAVAIVRLYALEAQPLWLSLPMLLAPLVSASLLGVVQLGWHPALWILAAVDLGLLALRVCLQVVAEPNLAEAFPELRNAVVCTFGVRLVTTLAALWLTHAKAEIPALAAFGAALLLDRFCFYAGARHHDPAARIATLKTTRMLQALREGSRN